MKKKPEAFSKDFEDILRLLGEHKVDFLVVGGWAMAAYGHQRMTKDLDIFVRASTENAQKIVQALHAFGAPKSLTQMSDFETPGMVIQLGIPPWRIDLLTEISGVDFEQAARHHTTFRFVNTLAPVIGKKELIRNKLATGRPQDILDISVLKRLSTRATPSKPKSMKRRKKRK